MQEKDKAFCLLRLYVSLLTSHLCLPFLLLPGRAVLAVCIFKCYNDPDSKEAGGDPGSRFLFVSAHAVSYELLKWIEIKT